VQNESELAEQHAAGLAMRTVQARSASQTLAFSGTSSQWGATKGIGSMKNVSPSSQRSQYDLLGVKSRRERVLPRHKQEGVQGYAVSRAPERQCWVTGGGVGWSSGGGLDGWVFTMGGGGVGGGSNSWCGGLHHCYTSAEKSYGGLLMGNCARSLRKRVGT
jgi:hypothetical protein